MPGLKISELQQPSLTADRNVSLQDIIPIARTIGAALSTFSLPGAAFFTNLASVGVGTALIGTKTFNVASGNSYNIKSLSAVAPILLNDNGSTLTLAISSSVLTSLAGLTPIKTSFIAGSNPPAVGATFFNLPNVSLPTDANAYRVDINGVIQEPNVDYTIITNTTPFQIQFSTAPATGEKVVIVAFAPGVNSLSANTILNANSVFANPTNVPFAATSVTVAQNQVLCNTNGNNLAGLSIGTNQFLGNIGTGLSAITLSAGGGIDLKTSSNTIILSAVPGVPGVPTGAIMSFYLAAAPSGWRDCDGTTITNSGETAALFALIGATLPNLQGQFIRGLTTNLARTSLDPLSASRTLGSTQVDGFKSHTHTISPTQVPLRTADTDRGTGNASLFSVDNTSTLTIGSEGDTETRPVNIALRYCIKL